MEKNRMMDWSVILASLAMMAVVMSANLGHAAAFTCVEAIQTLGPCTAFLVGAVAEPYPSCCAGLRTVQNRVTTKEDRQDLCECLKRAEPDMGVKPVNAKQLPLLCHVPVNIFFDPNLDCTKVT